jgi:hypothetical protein
MWTTSLKRLISKLNPVDQVVDKSGISGGPPVRRLQEETAHAQVDYYQRHNAAAASEAQRRRGQSGSSKKKDGSSRWEEGNSNYPE